MKTKLLLLLLIFIATDAFAQRRVSGIVVDKWDEPVIGAMIWEILTNSGIATNYHGEFQYITKRDTCELRISVIGFEPEYIKITNDTVITVALRENFILLDGITIVGLAPPERRTTARTHFYVRQQIIGADYDIVNSLFSVSFNSGYDNRIHRFVSAFKDKLSYKVSIQTNFKKDYGFESSMGLRNLIRQLDMLSLNYTYKNYSENADFKFNKISIKGSAYWQPVRLQLFAEPAIQSLNNNENFVLMLGAQRSFWRPRLTSQLSAGYFNDYWTYSARVKYFPIRKLGLQMSYEKIDRYDFLNVGVRYMISEVWR
jgi:hypothetical protein